MKVRVCPKCGKQNLENAVNCIDCGTTLSIKTLVDTESKQFASNIALSSISPSFEQEVAEILKTVKNGFEDVIWGCNIIQVTRKPPFLFGYLIVTSQRLIYTYFKAETNSRGIPKRSYLDLTDAFQKFKLEILFGLLIGLIMGKTSRTLVINDLNSPLTAQEKASRHLITFDLKNLVSTNIVSNWYGETHIKNLVMKFKQKDEATLTFTIPDDADKLFDLLKIRKA